MKTVTFQTNDTNKSTDKKYDTTIRRLTTILSLLYQGEKLKPKDLVDELGASLRTIQRDFSERLSQFPVQYDYTQKHWYMEDGFKLNKNIAVEDVVVLDILENISKSFGNSFHRKTSTLLHKLKNRHNCPIFTKLNMEDISDEINNLVKYEDAILNSQKIKINYTTDQKSEEIKINPIKIVNFDGFWYLVATDQNNKLKSYRIKNCKLLRTYKQTFTIPKTTETILNNAISIWFSDNEPFEVTLQIDNYVARFFKEKPISATQKIIEETENHIVVTVTATSDFEIIPIVKGWIPFIKVLDPIRIQETVVEEAKKFIEL